MAIADTKPSHTAVGMQGGLIAGDLLLCDGLRNQLLGNCLR